MNKFISKVILKTKNTYELLVMKNDLDTDIGRAREREKRIIYSAVTAVIAKVISTAIPLITVKITLSYLGYELYGLWTTIISFFSLFTFADLGLGNGLQTELSRISADGNKENCRKIISSAYFILLIVSLILIGVFIVIFPSVDWNIVMSAKSQEACAMTAGFVLAIFLSKLINIPFSLIQRTQNALQEGYIANAWSCMGSILSLIIVCIFSYFNLDKLTMMWASSFVIVITSFVNTIVFYWSRGKELRPKLRFVDCSIAKTLLSTGIMFFILSIITSISLSLDNYIVAKVTSLIETTPYSLAYKIASFIGIISTMLSTPLWAANGEALERGDMKWVKNQTFKMTKLSLVLSIVASVGLILFAKPVLGWLGDGMQVNYMMLIGMCCLQILIATTNPAFMVLNASRRIKVQMGMYSVYSIVSLALKYGMGIRYGAVAIAWIGPLCYLFIICPWVMNVTLRELGVKKK